LLRIRGFQIIFCAADGVAATATRDISLAELFSEIRSRSPTGFTFSAGVGSSLQEAYVALLNAKSQGKDRLCHFSDINL
jgi:hypothetical protein